MLLHLSLLGFPKAYPYSQAVGCFSPAALHPDKLYDTGLTRRKPEQRQDKQRR